MNLTGLQLQRKLYLRAEQSSSAVEGVKCLDLTLQDYKERILSGQLSLISSF